MIYLGSGCYEKEFLKIEIKNYGLGYFMKIIVFSKLLVVLVKVKIFCFLNILFYFIR